MIQPSRRRVARLSASVALAFSVLLPGAVPAAAADPVVIQVGTTQDLDATNPFNTALVVGYEVVPAHLQPAHRVRQGRRSPGPGSPTRWERSPDKVTFHIRDGMQWSDGTPATAKDVCFSWGLAMAAIKDDSYIGSGYLDPGVKDAGVTKIECPDDSTFIAYTTDQSDRIYQVYVPILPQHVYGKLDYKKIADEKFDGAARRAPGRTPSPSGRPASSPRFVRNPHFWGKQGFADEVVLRFFPDNTDTMVQALKSGELDYAHDVNPDQFKQLQTDPAYTAVVGAPTAGRSSPSTPTGRAPARPSRTAAPRRKALLDPAFRDALGYAVDHKELVDRVLGGFGDVGTTIVPPVLGDLHVEPDHLRTFDIDARQAEARRRRLHARRQRQAARQGRQADLAEPRLPEHERHVLEVRAVRAGVVRPARASTSRPRATTATRSARWSCRPRRIRPAPRSTTSSCGAGRATPIPTRCSRSSAATRSASGPTASTATRTTTSCTTCSRSSPARSGRRPSRRCRT